MVKILIIAHRRTLQEQRGSRRPNESGHANAPCGVSVKTFCGHKRTTLSRSRAVSEPRPFEEFLTRSRLQRLKLLLKMTTNLHKKSMS